MDERSDQQLLREYVGRGSDEAFTALVKRHTSLVFGTACRKLADPSLAEEITQTVFIVLARKAAFLCHHENLSGWLHQTALLECRHRLRGELRRQRREESAMEMHEEPNESPLAEELDEALLELAEKDRRPLLLRYFESLSLRQVATQLGIREDAAQKRVAKSLSLLERILRRRGHTVGSAAIAVALAESSQAAPAYLAASTANAALAATGTASAVGVAFGKFMALSKAQTAMACLVLVSAPLLLQTQRFLTARAAHEQAEQALAMQNDRSARLSETVRRLQRDILALQTERDGVSLQIAEIQNGGKPLAKLSPAQMYRWNATSAYVRLPKDLLDSVRLTTAKQSEMEKRYGLPPGLSLTNAVPKEIERNDPIDEKGNLSEALAEALDLSGEQKQAVGQAVRDVAAKFEAAAAQHTSITNVMAPGLQFSYRKDYELRTLLTSEFPEEGKRLKDELVADLTSQVGAERAQLILRQGHFVLDHAFLEYGARKRWISIAPTDDGKVTIGRAQTLNGVSIGGSINTVNPEEVPAELRAYLPTSTFAKNE